ncbi:MAG: PhnD/SsuA/transferrin family substrate-binding protein [Bacteroidota bacterium]
MIRLIHIANQYFSIILLVLFWGSGHMMFGQHSPLRVGVIKYKTTDAVEKTYKPLFTYVAEKLGKRLDFEIITDSSLAFRLHENEFDIGVFTPFPYLSAKQDFSDLEVFGSHVVQGQKSYRGGILVKKGSGIKTLGDLKGKRFSFVKKTSTSGFKLPQGIFTEYGIPLESFAEYEFSGGHDTSLWKLLKEETDGIAIDLLRMKILEEDDLIQIDTLKPFEVPYHAYLFGPGLPKKWRDSIAQIMFKAHKNPKIKTLFNNPLEIESWYPQDDEAYNPLRRYTRIVRVKPSIRLVWDVQPGAQKSLESQPDIMNLLERRIETMLDASKRFAGVKQVEGPHIHSVEIELVFVNDTYHFQISLDGELAGNGEVSQVGLTDELPGYVAESVLQSLPIETQLLTNGEKWFITYGLNDGLDSSSYEFVLHLQDDKELTLRKEDIHEMGPMNTTFFPQDEFASLSRLTIRYNQGLHGGTFNISKTVSQPQGGFWTQLDNVWGVIGLLVAVLTLGIGSFFTGRKKRRFRAMLYESNDLLREYIEGKQRIEGRLLDQEAKINRSLEKGIIDENQFLILKHRLEDIDHVIQKYLGKQESIPPQLAEELNNILEDGTITEKEFTRIISLVKKSEN